MKKNILFILLSIILVGSNACQEAEQKAKEALNEQVMSLHDKLMPQTEEIIQLKSQLDSLSTGKDSTHVKNLITSLSKAENEMMNWMHHFSIDSLDKMEVKNQVLYLKSQFNQLKNVENITDSTLNAAKKYISK
ncbi:hypothetical protein V7S76_04255 [Aquirufa sp. ROCK2-A2]